MGTREYMETMLRLAHVSSPKWKMPPLPLIWTEEEPMTPKKVDRWSHRSAGMRCRTCMWFVPKGAAEHYELNEPIHGPSEHIEGRPRSVGRCRRHAPTMSGYPVVFETDWCGDHKLDESKT